MNHNKFVPINEIIERVYTNHPFAVDNFQWSDALEWVGTLMKLIKSPVLQLHKVCKIDIENYKGELPIDLFQIETFRHGEKKQLMKFTGDPYFKQLHCNDSPCLNCPLDLPELRYQINNNFVFVGFEEGELEITYWAIPIDDNGFPLIPDIEDVKRAIEWEIASKLAYKEWINDRLTRDKFQYIEQQRNWYVAKAIISPKVPDIGKMEAIKNFTLRLIPKINVLDEQFKYNPERRITHNTNNFNQGAQF
jgi:hypothetical protein